MLQIGLDEAWDVHRRLLVLDGHNDTPVERVHRGEAPLNWMQRDPAYHMDVPRMIEGGLWRYYKKGRPWDGWLPQKPCAR